MQRSGAMMNKVLRQSCGMFKFKEASLRDTEGEAKKNEVDLPTEWARCFSSLLEIIRHAQEIPNDAILAEQEGR